MTTFRDRSNHLRMMADAFRDSAVSMLTDYVLSIPGFTTCSGSCKPEHHHYGTHGLVQHTWEVAKLCLNTEGFMYTLGKPVDPKALFLSAAFHDCGKTWDYELVDSYSPGMGNAFDGARWQGTPHKRLIHHISRSALVWAQAVRETGQGGGWEDDVLHAILSHHGTREWGSPVAPKTRLAWMLHLCDNLSARCDDCDRLDVVKGRD